MFPRSTFYGKINNATVVLINLPALQIEEVQNESKNKRYDYWSHFSYGCGTRWMWRWRILLGVLIQSKPHATYNAKH